ncbi:unnamed protein product, partial [Allacma fusca]
LRRSLQQHMPITGLLT